MTWMILGYPSFFRKTSVTPQYLGTQPKHQRDLAESCMGYPMEFNQFYTDTELFSHVHTYPKILVIRLYCKYEFAVQRTQYNIYIYSIYIYMYVCMYVCVYTLCILVSIIYKFMGTTDSGREVLESLAEKGAASLRNLIWNHVPWRVLPENLSNLTWISPKTTS